ncbi:pyrimidine 5'-nucleotidase [Sphingobium sp. BS19]|jgi:putative hydrolase of the HAD superfamily|uniref:pyrimidine 5'-nucleotidase n=1 Tax=Sphingobium sp. BS19 TaxID=3018973 RepID=UPI0022EEF1D1|nr:pyrimidine 5'-nucleotidase [Sphingobium sp. BS19]GLI99345.1 pyrimidine 5'-nucleotidase [Sphingobium sp. BS19]
MRADFAHIDSWIFDLDNTLYPAKADLFGLIDIKMGEFIQTLLGCDPVEARRVQKGYFMAHGTTLAGLMRDHDTDPREFLDYVHDISLDRIVADHDLIDHIAKLPGRRLIFTNGDAAYAARVLAKLGLSDAFELIHDIHACAYVPKPDPSGYAMLCDIHGINPTRSIFFEDMARNLIPAKALGMTTVWVNNGSEAGNVDAHADHIDYEIEHLTPFLADIHGD